METSMTSKRIGGERQENDQRDSKRRRSDEFDAESHNDVGHVERMIGVPIEFVFREVPQTTNQTSPTVSSQSHRCKALLSRSEAHCFLSVSFLAHELDHLVSLAATALDQKRVYTDFARKIEQADNPYLRPLLSLLHIVGNSHPNEALCRIQTEMKNVVEELDSLATSLKHFSEQNWTLSESLMDALSGTAGEILATEKRKLSDLQDEISNRIGVLLSSLRDEANQCNSHQRPSFGEDQQTELIPMEDFCRQIFQQVSASYNDAGSCAATSPSASLLLQQTADSVSDNRKLTPGSEGKENTPSQQRLVLEELACTALKSGSNAESQNVAGQSVNFAAEALSALASTRWSDSK